MDLDDVGASDPSICTLHVCCQRPYHVESTGSRPITGVKQRRARLVLGWVTAWEHRVLLNFFTFLISVGFAVDANSRMMIYNNKKKEQEKKEKKKKHILDASVSFSTGVVSMQPLKKKKNFYSFINSGFSVQVQTTVIILLI